MKIILPWPARALSPNYRSRSHWPRTTALKVARQDAYIMALASKARIEHDGPVPLTVTFHPPDNRHRDRDNLISSVKAQTDGIADALRVNDRRFNINYVVGEVRKRGEVVFSIGGEI